MEISLNYGKEGLAVPLDDGWRVTTLVKPSMPLLADPHAAMAEALARPVASPQLASPPLAEQARRAGPGANACILICDITRPVPNGVILPPLVRTLLESGLSPERIQVLVATGLHRPNEGEELAEVVGDAWVLETCPVHNHDARDDGAHVDLGLTSRGTRVRLDRRFVEADLRIVTGLVEPHFMAGFSGGRKVIAPGVAHAETITTFHSARFMEDPRAANCVLEGNPLHAEQLEIVEMVGGAMAVNVVIDEERRPAFLNFGEVVASHGEAVEFLRVYAEVPVRERFSTVLTSAAGYPLDKTYYQTVKGMVGAMDILAPGGDLIIASACSEGMGSPEYVAAQRRLVAQGPEGFLASIMGKTHADVDEWQTEMQLKPMRQGQIHLYTEGLSESEQALTGVARAPSVTEALRASVARSGDPRIAVIPEGPYVVPVYRPEG